MADTATLIALAERVEKATGPDRELDALIAEAAGWSDVWYRDGMAEGWAPGGVCEAGVPHYTASLDAAMSLVPEGWDHMEVYRPDHQTLGWTVHLKPNANIGREGWTGFAQSYALAVVAAALRAIGKQGYESFHTR